MLTAVERTPDAISPVASPDFVSAMAGAVNGVSVVTTYGPAGRVGITVSSVASVSASPPLLLVSINRRSPAHHALKENQVFCINLLSASQREVANTFAGHPTAGEPYDFEIGRWSSAVTGSPQLRDAVSSFDCVLEETHDVGTHMIFIGRVVDVRESGGLALLYARRAYGYPRLLS